MRLPVLLALLALLAAPFGRMAAAEAAAVPHHGVATAAAPGHCGDMAAPDEDEGDRRVDCLAACTAVAATEAPPAPPAPGAALAPSPSPTLEFTGIDLAADPPPPRIS